MPCKDDGQSAYYCAKIHGAWKDMLCQAVNLLRQHNIPLTADLEAFATEHDLEDAQRRERERAQAATERRRQAALKKLTPQEQALLGVDRYVR